MNGNKKTENYNTSCDLDPPHTLDPDLQMYVRKMFSASFAPQPVENNTQ